MCKKVEDVSQTVFFYDVSNIKGKFILKDVFIFIWKEDAQRKEEKWKKILNMLIFFPYDCNSQSWANPEPNVKSFLWVSYMTTGSKDIGSSFVAFLDRKQEAG